MNKYKTFEELKKELGDKYDKFMYDMNLELVKQKDKAIEYIKSHKEERAYYEPFGIPTGIPNHYEYFVEGYYELLEILQGKSDE